MRYTATNYMGSTPATSYQNTKTVCLNLDLFFSYPAQIRQFIALHEEGHIKLDTDSEVEADNYAFSKISGHYPGSHRWAILAVSRVLPFFTKDQYIRLLNMYKNALIAESYETNSATPYETSYVNALVKEAQQMNEAEFNALNSVDPVSGEVIPKRTPMDPVGPFVEIARQSWTKAKLGQELSGYDLTILDKYPMPADFEAYELSRNDVLSVPPPINNAVPLRPAPAEITVEPAPTQESEEPEQTTKIKINPLWFWIIAAVVLFLLIKK